MDYNCNSLDLYIYKSKPKRLDRCPKDTILTVSNLKHSLRLRIIEEDYLSAEKTKNLIIKKGGDPKISNDELNFLQGFKSVDEYRNHLWKNGIFKHESHG
jgi:hypothetical protein